MSLIFEVKFIDDPLKSAQRKQKLLSPQGWSFLFSYYLGLLSILLYLPLPREEEWWFDRSNLTYTGSKFLRCIIIFRSLNLFKNLLFVTKKGNGKQKREQNRRLYIKLKINCVISLKLTRVLMLCRLGRNQLWFWCI